MKPESLNASLHHALIRHILDHGHGPDTQELSRILGLPEGPGGNTWAIPASHSRF